MVDLFTHLNDEFSINKKIDYNNIENNDLSSSIDNSDTDNEYELNLNNDFIHELTYNDYERQMELLVKTVNESKKIFNSIVEVGEKKMREIGFPTVNLRYDNFVIKDGFYLSKLNIDKEEYYGLSLLDNYEKKAKIYILDFNKNIYGKKITTTVLEFIAQFYDKNKMSLCSQFTKNLFIAKQLISSRNK